MIRAVLTCAATAAVIGVSAPAASAQAPAEINFGVIATEAAISLKKNWEPFLQAMSKATGFRINGFYATDYAGVIEAMRFGKVQVAWHGNKSAIEAVDRANAAVFLQTAARDGSPGYYAHIIAHKDSGFSKLEDILKCDKSLDFGIGDPNSTSGFLVPMSYIFAARNIDPKACFKTVRNANHQANAMAVANKQVAAATNNNEDLERMQASAPEPRGRIKAIWTSPLIPLDPFVWRKDLDPAVKTRLYTFLMSYGRIGSADEIKTAKAVLSGLLWAPFRPSSNHQLLPIRILEANKNLMKVQADEKLSADDKTKQIAAIRADIARLEQAQKKAEADPFLKRAAAFVEIDKTGNQEELKKMIAEFAASVVSTN